MEKFCIIQNSEGEETFQCSLCDTTFGSQKSVRTHITVKHKQAKTFPSKVKDKPLDGDTNEGEFNFDEDDLTKSTCQVSQV